MYVNALYAFLCLFFVSIYYLLNIKFGNMEAGSSALLNISLWPSLITATDRV